MNAQPASVTRLRVLLVEDCAADAELIRDALRRAGFDPLIQRVETEHGYLVHLAPDLDVILAADTVPRLDAVRALELANERGCRVPFIMIMPRLNGPDLFRRLVAEKPGLKVVYVSGYATEAMARQVGLDRSQPYIQKPFTADQLALNVRNVLDGRRLQRMN